MATDYKPKPGERVVITGWPKVGKTTLTSALGGGRSTDEVMNLGWSEASQEVSTWFDKPGPWIIEGVAIPRALRKWKERNPNKKPPIDRLIRLTQIHVELNTKQAGMGKGLDKVLSEIMPWLKKHVEIQSVATVDIPKAKAKPRKKAEKVSDTAKDIDAVMADFDKEPVRKTTKTAAKSAKKEAKASKPAAEKKTGNRRTPRPSARDALIIAERQELVYNLYRGGATIRQISKILEEKGYGRCSKTTIGRDVRSGIEEAKAHRDLSRDEWLTILIDDAVDLKAAFRPLALKDRDKDAAEVVFKANDKLDRYLNISKAQKSETDARTALAKLLGVTPEELPDERAA